MKPGPFLHTLALGLAGLTQAFAQNKTDLKLSPALTPAPSVYKTVVRSSAGEDPAAVHGKTLIELFRDEPLKQTIVTLHATDGANGGAKNRTITPDEINFAQIDVTDFGANTTSYTYLYRNPDGTFRVASGSHDDRGTPHANPDGQVRSLGAVPALKAVCPTLR